MTSKSELNIIVCGGAGINIAKQLKNSKYSEKVAKATYVALDASGNNRLPEELGIPLERVPLSGDQKQLAQGSGKVKATNYAEAQPFVTRVMERYTPGIFNVVICSGAGGSGSMLATLVIRWLKQNGHSAVLAIITDHTSQVEMENSIKTMQSMAIQTGPTQLNAPINYMEFRNTPEKTRGEVDKELINKVSLYSLFATRDNEEQDVQDLLNILDYSKHYGVPPALSHISFYSDAANYKGPVPVATVSLFDKAENIQTAFPGTVIRSTGIFGKSAQLPGDTNQLHMVFDHGEAVTQLEGQLADLKKRKSETSGAYVVQKDLGAAEADANGVLL